MNQRMKRQTFDLLLSNEQVKRVTLTIRDSLAYESAARGKGWGSPQDHPMRMQAIRAWSALRREHPETVGEIGWKQFVEGDDPTQLHILDMHPARPDSDTGDESEVGELGESGRTDHTID